jgi:hypothetical protein
MVEKIEAVERSDMRHVVGDHLFHCLESGRTALLVLAARQSDIEGCRNAMLRFGVTEEMLGAIDNEEFPAEVAQLF